MAMFLLYVILAPTKAHHNMAANHHYRQS